MDEDWKHHIEVLLAAALPCCAYCPKKIATKVQWMMPLCDVCAAGKSKPDTLPIVDYPYAESVRKLRT